VTPLRIEYRRQRAAAVHMPIFIGKRSHNNHKRTMSTYVVVAVTASWKADTRSSGGAFSPPKPGNGKNKEHIVLLDTATLKQRKLSRLLYGVLGTSGDAIREGILMNGGLNVAQLTFSKPPPYDSVSSASRPIPLKFDNVLFERMQVSYLSSTHYMTSTIVSAM
jgi:hypothetical protein